MRVVDECSLKEIPGLNDRRVTWSSLAGLNRITEQVAKVIFFYCVNLFFLFFRFCVISFVKNISGSNDLLCPHSEGSVKGGSGDAILYQTV